MQLHKSAGLLCRVVLPCLLAASPAHAAISPAERQALIDLYVGTNGAGWTSATNWTFGGGFNAIGTECTWLGVTCDAAQTTVERIELTSNRLSGTLPPSLVALTHLQVFDLSSAPYLNNLELNGNKLVGSIPALTGLSQLQVFDVSYNTLSGPIPVLTGLSSLRSFDVEKNALTGSIPALSGLANLQAIKVGGNNLAGALPPAPVTLTASGSTLCPNQFVPTPDSAWDAATGTTPWYAHGCAGTPTATTLRSSWSPSLGGQAVTFAATIENADAGGPSGTVRFVDITAGGTLCDAAPVSVSINSGLFPASRAACTKVLSGIGTHEIAAIYSGDSGYYASMSSPVAQTVGANITTNGNQFGVTGSWYDPLIPGQGVLLGVYPDLIDVARGMFYAGWFTYDITAAHGLRWYTLQGEIDLNAAESLVTIYDATGGNFNSAVPVLIHPIGTATVSFGDCTHATVKYVFNDGSARSGTLALQRGDANVTCNIPDDYSALDADYRLSGAWYNPGFSKQGFLFDINPAQSLLFGAWYTFALNGQTVDGGASQRWYTLQANNYVPGSRSIAGVGIYAADAGAFDAPTLVGTTQVGTANIRFISCSAMLLDYAFTGGENAGQAGTIPLRTVGPPAPGCL